MKNTANHKTWKVAILTAALSGMLTLALPTPASADVFGPGVTTPIDDPDETPSLPIVIDVIKGAPFVIGPFPQPGEEGLLPICVGCNAGTNPTQPTEPTNVLHGGGSDQNTSQFGRSR